MEQYCLQLETQLMYILLLNILILIDKHRKSPGLGTVITVCEIQNKCIRKDFGKTI